MRAAAGGLGTASLPPRRWDPPPGTQTAPSPRPPRPRPAEGPARPGTGFQGVLGGGSGHRGHTRSRETQGKGDTHAHTQGDRQTQRERCILFLWRQGNARPPTRQRQQGAPRPGFRMAIPPGPERGDSGEAGGNQGHENREGHMGTETAAEKEDTTHQLGTNWTLFELRNRNL